MEMMDSGSNLKLSIALPGHALNPFFDGGSGSGCNNGGGELQQGGSTEVQEGEERGGVMERSTTRMRLSMEQYMQLDEFYRLNPKINSKQKKELADRLNLRTSQVDAWIRNRRAREKKKSTEMELANLKEENNKLKEDNHRLKGQFWGLRAMIFQMQFPVPAPCEQQADSAASATMVNYL